MTNPRHPQSDLTDAGPQEHHMNEQTPITDVMTVAIPVADQDRALDFYLETLGLEKRRDVPLAQFGGRWIEVAPPSATVTIALVLAGEARPAGGESGLRLSTGDAAALHAQLQARGVDVGELLRWPGVPPMFNLRDRDGNGLTIVQAG
jgi:lactoylglutathione lyase